MTGLPNANDICTLVEFLMKSVVIQSDGKNPMVISIFWIPSQHSDAIGKLKKYGNILAKERGEQRWKAKRTESKEMKGWVLQTEGFR